MWVVKRIAPARKTGRIVRSHRPKKIGVQDVEICAADTTSVQTRCEQENMKSSTTDKIQGVAHEAKGRAKEIAGKVIGNPDLQDQGTAEKLAGKVQRKVGDVKKVFGK